MTRTKRKGGSRKSRGGFLDAIAAATKRQAALISKAAKEAADKAKSMAVKVHHETIKNIDRGKQAFEQTANAGIAHAKNIASKTGATAALATGAPQAMISNPQSAPTAMISNPQRGGNRRKTHKKKHRRKTHKRKHRRKTHKRKPRRKRKTHRRHH
jgi:hypothetical protein